MKLGINKIFSGLASFGALFDQDITSFSRGAGLDLPGNRQFAVYHLEGAARHDGNVELGLLVDDGRYRARDLQENSVFAPFFTSKFPLLLTERDHARGLIRRFNDREPLSRIFPDVAGKGMIPSALVKSETVHGVHPAIPSAYAFEEAACRADFRDLGYR